MKWPDSVYLGGSVLGIGLVDQPTASDGTKCDGLYILEDKRILLKRSISTERQGRVFLHELAHGTFDESDLELRLRKMLRPKIDMDEVDEEIARAISGPYVGALRSIGWLKFPWEK